AAIVQILAPILPEIARAVAEPLAKIDRITLVNTGGANGAGGDGISRITSEAAKVIAQVPPVVGSLPGLKIDELFAKARGTPPPPAAVSGEKPAELPKAAPAKPNGGAEAPGSKRS